MMSIRPREEALRAFEALGRSSVASYRRIMALWTIDSQYRDRSDRDRASVLRNDVWYDREGRPQMQMHYGVWRFLSLNGDLRRMRLAAEVLRAEHPGSTDILAPLSSIDVDLMDQAFWPTMIWPGLAQSVQQTVLSDLERATDTSRDFRALLEQLRSDAGRILQADEHAILLSGEEYEATIAERALEIVQHADDSYLVLIELAAIDDNPERQRLQQLAENMTRSWEDPLPNGLRLEDFPQLCAGIDSLLATRMLAPSVEVPVATGQTRDSWAAYPWLSLHARRMGRRMMDANPDMYQGLQTLLGRADIAPDVRQSLLVLLNQILEISQGSTSALKKRLDHGLGWEAGGGMINMIPGQPSSVCHSVLVVVSLGGQFGTRMREAIDHCIHCHDQTRLVIVVTDDWKERMYIKDFQSTFQALRRQFNVRLAAITVLGGKPTFHTVIN